MPACPASQEVLLTAGVSRQPPPVSLLAQKGDGAMRDPPMMFAKHPGRAAAARPDFSTISVQVIQVPFGTSTRAAL